MSSISKQLSSVNCTGRKEPSSSTEVRLVLLGRTGNGKSSTGNSILGWKAFESRVSSSSVTQRCRRVYGDFRGRHITLLDTPGLLDTHQTPQEVQKELRKSVSLMFPGPHAFLLVFQIGRFTQEEKEAVRQIKQALGPQALGFSVVVFTHGDCLDQGTSVMPCLIEKSEGLAELVARCGGRYCIFNNQNSKAKWQVSELLELVDRMLDVNRGSCFTSKMLYEAEKEMAREREEERRLLIEKEELVKRKQETSIREWYQSELEKIQLKSKREMEELRKKQEMQREKEEGLAREREEASKREVEEKNEKKEKEQKIHEMVRVMEIRREEEMKREALQKKLDTVSKTLEEQTVRAERMRRAMDEKTQNDRGENEKKEKERKLQQIEREQDIRWREEMKREAMQKELDKLTQSLEEQSRTEERRTKQREELIRHEREENQREREREKENQKAQKGRNEALQRQLWLITMKLEEQKAREEKLKRELDESLWKEKERCDVEIHKLKKQCDQKSSEQCNEAFPKTSAEEHTGRAFVRPVTGYIQEMGLVVLNVALESIGAPCCLQ